MSAVLPGQDSRKGWKDRLPWKRQDEDSVPVRMPEPFPNATQNAARVFWWLHETAGEAAASAWARA